MSQEKLEDRIKCPYCGHVQEGVRKSPESKILEETFKAMGITFEKKKKYHWMCDKCGEVNVINERGL